MFSLLTLLVNSILLLEFLNFTDKHADIITLYHFLMMLEGILDKMSAFFREAADTVTFGGEEITVCVEVGALA